MKRRIMGSSRLYKIHVDDWTYKIQRDESIPSRCYSEQVII